MISEQDQRLAEVNKHNNLCLIRYKHAMCSIIKSIFNDKWADRFIHKIDHWFHDIKPHLSQDNSILFNGVFDATKFYYNDIMINLLENEIKNNTTIETKKMAFGSECVVLTFKHKSIEEFIREYILTFGTQDQIEHYHKALSDATCLSPKGYNCF